MREHFLSGFTDEAADSLEGQIKVLDALDWKFMEARRVNGFNIHDLDDSAFDHVCAILDNTDIKINCFGSTIANHDTPVETNFDATMAVVQRSISRMKRLDVKFIRIMSYAIIFDEMRRPLPDQKKAKRFENLNRICGAFLEAGITPLHENAYNYGSMSWEHTLEMLEAVPGLRLIFDTGDAGIMPDYRKEYPYPNQDCMEVWEHTKAHVLHFHIKDGYRDPESGVRVYLYPGEGDCEIGKIAADAVSSGYSGGFTIEPNMVTGIHDFSEKNSNEYRLSNFLEYCKLTEELFRSLGCAVRNGFVYTE